MKSHIVQQLNQLNKVFYTKTAAAFDATRQQPWQGWLELKPLFEKALGEPSAKCLDIGCGNGRFAVYLTEVLQNKDWQYVGLDSSKGLLQKAKDSLSNTKASLIELDLIDALLNSKPLSLPDHPNVITLFGVLHHIPSFELRLQLFEALKQLASEKTTFIVTAWQFIEDENLMKRRVLPETITINSTDLEENDYLLTWERGVNATRYCHYASDEEMQKLAHKSGWTINQQLIADGKSNTLNHYFVLNIT